MTREGGRRITERLGAAAILAGLLVAGSALVAGGAVGAPGNNGFVKIHSVDADDGPGDPNDPGTFNDPHVPCQFNVDFWNYDLGDGPADVHLYAWPPSGVKQELNPPGWTAAIGGDAAGGGNDFDGRVTIDLSQYLAGLVRHPQQGYHIKLEVHAKGSQGSDKKHKVFWVDCQAPVVQQLGDLVVTKHITGVGGAGPFVFHVDCGAVNLGANADFNLVNDGDSKTITGIPQGQSCTVTETDANGATSTTYTETSGTPNDGTVTIGAGSTPVDVTNDFQARVATGDLTVSKTTSGPDAAGKGPFTFHVSCPGFVLGANADFTLAAGANKPITGIPQGVTCTVTETDANGASSTTIVDSSAPANDGAVAIGAALSTVAFDNVFDPQLSTLTVTKKVTGPAAGNAAFDFTASCTGVTLAAGDAAFTLHDNEVKVISGIPVGTSCTVAETGKGGAASTDVVDSTGPDTQDGVVTIAAGGTTNVAFTNHFNNGNPGGCVNCVPPPAGCQVNCSTGDPGTPRDPGDPGDPADPGQPVVVPGTPVTPPEVGPAQQVDNPAVVPDPQVPTVVLGETIVQPQAAPAQVQAAELARTGFAYVRELVFGGTLLVLLGLLMLAGERRTRPLLVWRRDR